MPGLLSYLSNPAFLVFVHTITNSLTTKDAPRRRINLPAIIYARIPLDTKLIFMQIFAPDREMGTSKIWGMGDRRK
jgi:hypothetical protein